MSEGPSFDAGGQRPNFDELNLSEFELKLQRKILENVLRFPNAFKDWLRDQFLLNPPDIPISQVLGATLLAPVTAPPIATDQTRTANTYGDLATVGPELTGLADGVYLISFGASAYPGDGPSVGVGRMSVKVNATEAIDADSIYWFNNDQASRMPGSRMIEKTLSGGGNNTLTCRYKNEQNAGNYRWLNRWMTVLRVANP